MTIKDPVDMAKKKSARSRIQLPEDLANRIRGLAALKGLSVAEYLEGLIKKEVK